MMQYFNKNMQLILLLLFLLSTGSSFKERPVRILCVGDSITQGGKNSQPEHTYRLPLQMLLRERKISFDFIGSRQKGLHEDVLWPEIAEGVPFDPDHEGYYGHKTEAVCTKVMEAFAGYTEYPDIVLVHLGTNDQKEGNYENTVGLPLRNFIGFLREKNPNVAVFLGHLNFNHGEVAEAIRVVVEKVAADLNLPQSPITTVHHYKGWRENPENVYTDTFDWAHPNLKGQEKMAVNWMQAMEPWIRK
ncbi:MAG: GDSL-type esterase/lipase family protein [Mariniphaga sp.]|nr:GDSL-type esterase/lipase family protein [Mariniphaga sp.]